MDGVLVERGFLFGPVIPIYGFGAMAIVGSLSLLENNIFSIFFLGVILTSALEYITSFILEKMFDLRWWDYTKQKYNIRGRICLRNSLMFGFLSVLVIQYIHPFVSGFINTININTLNAFAKVTFLIVMLDFSLSVKEVINFKNYVVEIDKLRITVQTLLSEENIRMSFKQFLNQKDEYFDNLDIKFKDLQETIEKKHQQFLKHEKRLLNRFPDITSKRFEKIIQSIKEYKKK